ncbi:MAG TPA: vWA domain-containing protein, partial [Kofleriaceae bacterium]|nr:vWA domain-containing protein [Kofleriaceae bacterium]
MDRASLALLLLAAVGCGSGSAGGGPCDEDPPLEGCGDTCEVDEDCPAGLHCGEDGTCTAECSGDDDCPDGQVCDDKGTCVADDGDDGCPDVSVNLTPITPTVMILIDRSGSMITSGFGSFSTRWEAVEYALTDTQDGVLWDVNSQIIVGASLYTSDNGDAGGECPMLMQRAPMADNAMAIRNLIANNPPYDDQLDTPTAEAITATVAGFPEAENRVLILATDGNPDNCADPDAHDAGSQRMSEDAVAAAYADPYNIPTFVLSVGDDATLSHLQRLARLGRGQNPMTGNAEPYVANSPAELVDAFGEIIRGVRSCDIDINGTVDLDQADQGEVVMNG